MLLTTFVPEAVGRVHPGAGLGAGHAVDAPGRDPRPVAVGIAAGGPLPGGDERFGIRPITVAPGDVTFDLDGCSRSREQRRRRGVHDPRAAGRRPLAGRVDGPRRAVRRAGRPGHDHGRPDCAPHAQGIPSTQNLAAVGARAARVIGLPLIAGPVGILIVRRRGRMTASRRRERPRAGDDALARRRAGGCGEPGQLGQERRTTASRAAASGTLAIAISSSAAVSAERALEPARTVSGSPTTCAAR